MSIITKCGSCNKKFKAKDSMAGKRVKCPGCSQPITVPNPKETVPAAPSPTVSNYSPILDLLDEAGVKSVPTGPVCHSCGAEMQPTSVICVECGYNMATGEQLETEVYEDADDIVDTGRSDADKIMAKAEKAIDETPVTAEGQDFGDGADSAIIAVIAGIAFLIVLGLGVGVVLFMDVIVEQFGLTPEGISFTASIFIYIGCVVWISVVAYLMKPAQAIICICTGGLYCIIFGLMQGSTMLVPTIGLLISLIIGGISYGVMAYNAADTSSLISPIMAMLC